MPFIGGSVFLVVVGAILTWAVTVEVEGFNIQLAGLILFVVGILGLFASIFMWVTRRRCEDEEITTTTRHRDVPPRDTERF